MQETLNQAPTDAARSELEAVAASLVRTPRLEQLLRFLAQRHLEGRSDELTEYNIATEVFGRKKTEFIASEDAIARVETHRLRKKLTIFYETQGKDHSVQISIPLGTYVPLFTERPEAPIATKLESVPVETSDPDAAVISPPLEDAVAAIPETSGIDMAPPSPRRTRLLWPLAVAAFALAIVALLCYVGLRSRTGTDEAGRRPGEDNGHKGAANAGAAGASAAPVGFASAPFRMIAGYSGPPQRDNSGDMWQSDAYFQGGWPRHQSKAYIARTGNPVLFRYGRDGDSAYDIPLAPGSYELHLYFMQGSDTDQSEDAENKAIFTVTINGTAALKDFDIVSDAMGRNIADERVFRDISPATDGKLHIQLNTVLGTPSICAIEILPNTSHRQLPVRLVMQPATYTDQKGQLWRPDDYFLSGRFLSHNLPSTSSETDVLPFERYGHFEYAIPVDARDHYTVTLRFVELYFGTDESDIEERRIFRVLCNGQTLVDHLDIMKEVGTFHVLQKTFHNIRPTAQGKLNLDFEPISNYATVSAIEVLPESY